VTRMSRLRLVTFMSEMLTTISMAFGVSGPLGCES
jgi:hypothetical protein